MPLAPTTSGGADRDPEQRRPPRPALLVPFLGEVPGAAAPRRERRRRPPRGLRPLRSVAVAVAVGLAAHAVASWAVDDGHPSLPLASPGAAGASPPAGDPVTRPEPGAAPVPRPTPSPDPRPAPTPGPAAEPAPVPSAPTTTTAPPRPSVARHGSPVGVRVDAVGIDVPLVPLGLEPDGTLEVPSDFQTAGWYRHAPLPGDVGPAVIAAHVDSYRGPAAFFELRDVRPGDEVAVTYTDGTEVRFRVDRVERHAKDAFPTDRVYGNVDDAQLRLITCGGQFDRSVRSYRDNIIVWATRLA